LSGFDQEDKKQALFFSRFFYTQTKMVYNKRLNHTKACNPVYNPGEMGKLTGYDRIPEVNSTGHDKRTDLTKKVFRLG
jgi:hypothetical protein